MSPEALAEGKKIREQIKALLRGEEVEPASPSGGRARPGRGAGAGTRAAVGNGHALGSSALVNEYNEVRKKLGRGSSPVDSKALAAKLSKHAAAVREKTGCREVRFRVIEEGGKARVKAIPVK